MSWWLYTKEKLPEVLRNNCDGAAKTPAYSNSVIVMIPPKPQYKWLVVLRWSDHF